MKQHSTCQMIGSVLEGASGGGGGGQHFPQVATERGRNLSISPEAFEGLSLLLPFFQQQYMTQLRAQLECKEAQGTGRHLPRQQFM